MVPPATHRTILVVDVEKFGDHSRTDAQRVTIHEGLYELLHEAFQATGISWGSCHCEDRGDGVMVLAPPDIPKILFSDRLPYYMASALQRYNLAHRAEERIRLRMVLHAGEVTIDSNGVVSSAVNMAFRLLDAALLKEALQACKGGALALIASSRFYFEVIRNSPKFCPSAYFPIPANVKETDTIGWVTMPGPRGPVRRRAKSESWRARLRESAGGPIHGPGIIVGGRYVIVSAHVAARALRLGSHESTALPAGQVLFDVPAIPRLGIQRAVIIFWCPAAPRGQRPGLGVAGLSIAGPAIRGIGDPAFRFDLGTRARIVRLRACDFPGGSRDKFTAWARLSGYDANGAPWIPLSRLTDESPDITGRYHGSDVVDAQTGDILGIAVMDPSGGSRERACLVPMGRIAEEWPLLHRMTAPGTDGIPAELGFRAPSSVDILPLVEKSLEVPVLANAQSRHRIVSELPFEVISTAPRSSADRADVAALLWSCTRVPGALNELAEKIRETSLGRSNADDLANDLERLQA
jgi:Effector-associated domain 2